MSSKKVEDIHKTLLAKLLSDSGIVCLRSPQLSKESEEEEIEIEEEAATVEEEPVKEEQLVVIADQISEEHIPEQAPSPFPTPSIRRVIPERLRRIEAHNRIKVLPESFKSEIDPAAIPKINSTAPQKYIEILAELTGCNMYKISQAEYWFLDTLANLLRRAQESQLERPIQAILILWFCEWMKEMQHFDAASRERMLRRWKDNMLQTAKFIVEQGYIPTPELAGVYYKAKEPSARDDRDESKLASAATPLPTGPPPTPTPALQIQLPGDSSVGGLYECSIRDLTKIIHYIYDLFGTDYQYDFVRSIFTFGPDYNLIDGPFPLEVPKSQYSLLKGRPGKKEATKSPKKDATSSTGKKERKKEVLTEEYLALMAVVYLLKNVAGLRGNHWKCEGIDVPYSPAVGEKAAMFRRLAKENEAYAEKELQELEEWNKRSHILPLHFAADDAFFDFYWPPPTPEPEPEPVIEPTKKGKKK